MRHRATRRVAVSFGAKPEARELFDEVARRLDVSRSEVIRAMLRKGVGNKTDPDVLAQFLDSEVIRV